MNEFLRLYLKLRETQRAYFKAERGSAEKSSLLRQSKALESECDRRAAALIKERADLQLEL